jgi:Spy/CpxP family protein refolding chaperone
MFIRTIIISVFAFSLLVSPVWSEMDQHARWTSGLGLNQEQQSKLLKIHNEMRNIREKHRDSIVSVRLKIRNELAQPKPSKQILDGYAVELGKLHTDQIQNNTEQMLKIKEILTPEQFSKVIDKGWMGQGKGMHGRFNGKRGTGTRAECVDNPVDQGNIK